MRRIHELCTGKIILNDRQQEENCFLLPGFSCLKSRKVRVNILAMGDVGGTLALGLRLLGGDIIRQIGICDIDPKAVSRWEHELNQIAMPMDPEAFPEVIPTAAENLFDCDVFVFCASRGVPALGSTGDVRMVQLEKNRQLISVYADQAVKAGFAGDFFVVSDPVDPLCRSVLNAGISPCRISPANDMPMMMAVCLIYFIRKTRICVFCSLLQPADLPVCASPASLRNIIRFTTAMRGSCKRRKSFHRRIIPLSS